MCATAGWSLELPDIISSNMVLQQKSPALLWGWAQPGSTVTVKPSWPQASSATATAGPDGRWDVHVATPQAGYTPYYIEITGDGQTVRLDDVLVGEVWFASGQSNMEMPLEGFEGQPVDGANLAIAHSGRYRDRIRMATVPRTQARVPQEKVGGVWRKSEPEYAPKMSAAAYHFAKELNEMLDVPVGIVSCPYGGASVESWMPEELLKNYPDIDLKALDDQTTWFWETPEVMYNGMLWPLHGYTVKGFLWNQGETNVKNPPVYAERFATMAHHWRQLWGNDTLPFITVELPPYIYGDGPDGISGAELREQQWKAAELAAPCEVVSSADLAYPGEEMVIHPRKKEQLGQRLAHKAAVKYYGVKGVCGDSPRFERMEVNGPTATLYVTGHEVGFYPFNNLQGFEVAGADGVLRPVQAKQVGTWGNWQLEVTNPTDEPIEEVRYAFRNIHPQANIFNCRQLPLVPFRARAPKPRKE